MSKADQLVKRAISFEALSILSDRKTFLQSIAQGFDPETIKQFENLDEFGNPKQEGIPAPEPVAYTMPTTNIVGKPPSGAIARK